jgi:hypothetical protein
MESKESKVILKTSTHTYEFSSLSHLTSEGIASSSSLTQRADVVYDKRQNKFVKCRNIHLDELNDLLELTRG